MMDQRDRAIELMRTGQFQEALPLFLLLLRENPNDAGAAYMAGQCCRFLSDFDGAVKHLSTAARLHPGQPEVFLALGIATQLRGDLGASREALERAIAADPDYVLAYNSLGLTLRKAGDLPGALETYRAAVAALARSIGAGLATRSDNPILRPRNHPGGALDRSCDTGCSVARR